MLKTLKLAPFGSGPYFWRLCAGIEAVRMLFGGWRRLGCGAMVLHLMLLWPLGGYGAGGSADNATCINDPSQCFREMLPIQEIQATAYTKAFAERFGLEPPVPGTEPTHGLEAMEVRVQRTVEWINLYSFTLYLYFDSRLPIRLPEDSMAGNKPMVLDAYHFFGDRQQGQFRKWATSEDRVYINKLNGSYNMRAFLATMDYVPEKKGAIDSIQYKEFRKELLPGLTYIQLQFFAPPILNSPYKDIGIFLQQAKDIDYREHIYIKPGDFLKFRIPDHILVQIKNWFPTVDAVNNTVLKLKKQQEQGAKQQIIKP